MRPEILSISRAKKALEAIHDWDSGLKTPEHPIAPLQKIAVPVGPLPGPLLARLAAYAHKQELVGVDRLAAMQLLKPGEISFQIQSVRRVSNKNDSSGTVLLVFTGGPCQTFTLNATKRLKNPK
jgi:hypothetical protein